MDKYLLIQQESERLLYRKVTMEDYSRWLEFFSSTEAIKYLFLPQNSPEELCKSWFNKIFDRYRNDKGGFMALIEKNSGNIVGLCGLLVQEIDDVDELEIGYSIIPSFP